MKRNALMLAKTAKILGMPVVLTSSMEEPDDSLDHRLRQTGGG